MSSIKFLVRRPIAIPELRLLGLLYAVKKTALALNPGARYVLIRADAHKAAFNKKAGKWVADRLHYTIDIKDASMTVNNMHLTLHGYIQENTETKIITNMFVVEEAKPKKNLDGTARIENDDNAQNKLWEFDEPVALSNAHLGEGFLTLGAKDFADWETFYKAEIARTGK
ncbi:hypothetical protein MMC30_007446 [Trapelia coarctata]|nr:hypothetical protein [Trapelia coarctata]